ncbi:MAG: Smr/MutS family protein [Deltaproteobacteria bacterium]|nr:Smr/MutS family protein [Deltaproteobacteria bacterium]
MNEENPQDSLKEENPPNYSEAEGPPDYSKAESTQDYSKTENPRDYSVAEGPQDNFKAEGSSDYSEAEDPQDSSEAESPQDSSEAEGSQDYSEAEDPQDSSEAESPPAPAEEESGEPCGPLESPLEREYRELLALLADEAASAPGAEAALGLSPSLDPEGIETSWKLIHEARVALLSAGSLELSAHLDLGPLLEKAAPEGSALAPEELLLLKEEALCCRAAKSHFRGLKEAAPGLWEMAEALATFPEFIEAMDRCLSPEGEILDTASPELSRIRSETMAARKAVTDRLVSLMRAEDFRHLVRDEIVTVRQDRFVIPVRASGAGKSRGLVHDWSKSGQTAYLEPLEAVEDNNRLAFLKKKEAAEIERILKKLSALSREAAGGLRASGAVLTRLDLILAQGRLSLAWNAQAPEYRPGEGLRLKGLRHPLLERRLAADGRKMTPLDFEIRPEAPTVVISGLNAGGKTVALKTLGLAVLLARTGLFVPCSPGSRLDFPERAMAVMGDNQDLESDLSTFSGHVRALRPVLRLAGPGTLVLLDELGGGTDPAEGQALALAVLEELQKSGAWIVAATHFHLVKTWATLTPGVIPAAVNSSADGSPSYGLSYGAPGFSGGLAMAGRLGLPARIIDKARGYLDDAHRRSLELLSRLDEARAEAAEAARRLDAERKSLKAEAEAARKAHDKEIARINRLHRESDQSLRSFLSRYRAAYDELKEEIRRKLTAGERVDPARPGMLKAEMGREAAKVRPPVVERPETILPPEDLKPGDRVLIRRLGSPGTVRSWNSAKGEGVVDSGKFMLKATLAELGRLPSSGKKPFAAGGFVHMDLAPPPETGVPGSLMLVGRSVEEALEEIDREIDRAIVKGRGNLTIIHGRGTGRLKTGIADFLKKHPRVRGFVTPEKPPERGGVTEVTLEV